MNLLVLDDHKIFGQSLSKLLEESERVEACKYIADYREIFAELASGKYDICLIDINLKEDLTGFDIIEELKDKFPEQKLVILSSYDLPIYRERAHKLGVAAYINKSVDIDELIGILDRLVQGGRVPVYGELVDRLSPRELEVLEELVQGSRKKDIAEKLHISERTLYNHIQNIYDKLGARNALEAYNIGLKLGYLDPFSND